MDRHGTPNHSPGSLVLLAVSAALFITHDEAAAFEAEGYGEEGVTLIVEEDGRWCVLGMSDEFDWQTGTQAFVEVVLTPEQMIRGVLLDSEGKPVADGRVRASGVVESSLRILLGDRAEAATSLDGAFELQGLRADAAHLVLCDAPGEGIAVRSTGSSASRIDLGAISLTGSGRVTGRFVDRWERPISGALLELTLADIVSLMPGGVDESILDEIILVGGAEKLVSSSQVSLNGDFEVGGPSVGGLQLTFKLGIRTLWEAPVDLSAGDLDLGTVHIETETRTLTGQLVAPDGMVAQPSQLDIINGRFLWARVESDGGGSFRFAVLHGSPHSVTIVQRSEDGFPVNRWTREVESFPVTLQCR